MAEVKIIYLPPGEGGRKQGVDDFLAAGHTVANLLAHATSELREPPRDEGEYPPVDVLYRATPSGLVWDKPTQHGVTPTPLTNFTARIVADVAEDDGIEAKRTFHVDARLGERERRFSVPAERFHSMGWTTEHLGASAIVYPGFSAKDHARTAIQLLSGDIDERTTYLHTGWRRGEDGYFYLHGGGAIGAEGPVEGVAVRLDGGLAPYHLPVPPEGQALKEAVQASLAMSKAAPDRTAFPLLAATFRAAIGETDFSVHIVGPTGGGKSELAALCTQHFGAGLDARNLASWESTENALEAKAFALKDSLVGVDDFAPSGSPYDVQRLHRKADRIIRGKGNASGRERMRADLTLRPPKPPRALILSTGEDVPRGQSLRARMQILEHGPDDLDWRALTTCQGDAREGLYASAMAGFVSYLARDYERIQQRLPAEKQRLREEASQAGQHKRTPGIVADLALGLKYFLAFAEEAGAVTTEEAAELWERGWKAILGAAASQAGHQAASEPARRFVELISSAVASGRAHIAATGGGKPQGNAGALGWRKTGDEYADWRPQGDRIGWVGGDDLYLEPEASYRLAQSQAQGGESLAVGVRTIRKRLKEKGYLASTDDKRQTLTVRRTVEGVKDRSVLHLRLSSLFSDGDEPDEPDAEGEEPDRNGGSG
ncbi:MAG: DUF927 domain-containing protein, partial [Actinomycetota bacterium]|nr:DUF927 domain-containing protein [Actinomycetota bacterium]